jgi:hypothetical protein
MTAIFALTSVALRAPSVSAKAELLTLLRIGTFYFALTAPSGGVRVRAPRLRGVLICYVAPGLRVCVKTSS